MRLLVVEDDVQIAEGLQRALRRAGYAVDVVGDARSAISALMGSDYDLALLDLGLPDDDGFSVLSSLRARNQRVPVLILSARDEMGDRLKGLNLGADDYMVKPFELAELEARIRAILRRAVAGAGGDLALGKLIYRQAERRVYRDGVAVYFSPRELGVLEVLLMRRGQLVNKQSLQDHLCEWSEELSDNAIELYIHRVRKKLEGAAVEIKTIRGFGYLLESRDDPGV